MADTGVEVGTAYVTVLPSTRGFHRELSADVDQASAAAGVSGGKQFAAGFGKALPAIGGALAAAFSVQKLMQFAGDSVQAASDLAESQSKVAVVFGQSSAAINAWAETSATSLLMSKQAALEAAGTYGNLFQAFGIGQQQATEMSTTLVQLAADLASFNNTSVDEALQALRSGLAGETEPLKRYGVALTDARMKQAALERGIWDGVGALDAGQKAQAAYAVIMQDTALAQGDVERTSDGYANTMRAVQAAVDDAQATIGGGLVDALTSAAGAMGGPEGLVSLIDNAAERVSILASGIGVLTANLLVIPDALGDRRMDALSNLFNGLARTLPGTGPLASLWNELGVLGEQAQLFQDIEAELGRAADMQDIYAGKTRSSAVEMSAAGKAAEAYATYLDEMRKRTEEAAGAQSTLADELERYNRANAVRGSGIAIRDQWRALDTMGERVWRGKGKDRHQVQLAFDPTVVGGRLGTDASGDKAREWAVRTAQAYMDRAELLGGQEAEDLLARGRKRLGRQFRQWGIDNPMDYASTFLRTPATLVTQNNIDQNALDPANVSDESQRLSRQTNYIFNGDIKVDSGAALKQAAEEARRLAGLSSRGAGPVAPVGTL